MKSPLIFFLLHLMIRVFQILSMSKHLGAWKKCLLGKMLLRKNAPFTLQVVSPMVTSIWGNVPVLGSLSDVCRRPCETVVNCQLPWESYESFRLFKISTSDFGTVGIGRRFGVCAYKFLTTVTEGVLHGVCKVVIRSSFGVIWRHKVSQGIGHFIRPLPKVRSG